MNETLRGFGYALADDLKKKQDRRATMSDEKEMLQYKADLKQKEEQEDFQTTMEQYNAVKNKYSSSKNKDSVFTDNQNTGYTNEVNAVKNAGTSFYDVLVKNISSKVENLTKESKSIEQEIAEARSNVQATGGKVKELMKADLANLEKKQTRILSSLDKQESKLQSATEKRFKLEQEKISSAKQTGVAKAWKAYIDAGGDPSRFDYTGLTTDSFEMGRLLQETSTLEKTQKPEEDKGKVLTEVAKEKQKRKLLVTQQYSRVKGMLQGNKLAYDNAMRQKKEMGIPEGTIGHSIARLGAKLENAAPDFFEEMTTKLYGESKSLTAIKTVDAQAMEVILSLSPILTGSTRVMSSVLDMLHITIPKGGVSQKQYEDLLAQTIANSYKLKVAYQKENMTEEELSGKSENEKIAFFSQAFFGTMLTKEQNEEMLDDITDVLYPPEEANFYALRPKSPEEAMERRKKRLKEKITKNISPEKLAKLKQMHGVG